MYSKGNYSSILIIKKKKKDAIVQGKKSVKVSTFCIDKFSPVFLFVKYSNVKNAEVQQKKLLFHFNHKEQQANSQSSGKRICKSE